MTRRSHRTLSLAIGLAPAMLVAQPIIEASNAPSPGFTAPFHELFGLPPLASGPNSVWDLTGATTTGTRQLQLAQPTSAPGASNFPFATVVAYADNIQPYSFLRVFNGQLQTLGVMTAVPRVYSDPLVSAVFPCTYNSTWTDSYAFPGEQGTRTYLADGYGTLIGPAGSLTDVLKVRSEYVSLDTVIQGTAYTGLMLEDVFWRSGIPWPVATSFWNRVYAGGQLIDEVRVGSVIGELPAAIGEWRDDSPVLQVWPNPSKGLLNLSLDQPGTWAVTCFDALGRNVFTLGVLGTPSSLVPVDLGPLAPGRYVLRVQHETGTLFHAAVVRE